MRILLVSFLANLVALGSVSVTSQEQFGRLSEGGSPGLNYNFARAYLEVASRHQLPVRQQGILFCSYQRGRPCEKC